MTTSRLANGLRPASNVRLRFAEMLSEVFCLREELDDRLLSNDTRAKIKDALSVVHGELRAILEESVT